MRSDAGHLRREGDVRSDELVGEQALAALGMPLAWFDPRTLSVADGTALSSYTSRVNGYSVAQSVESQRPTLDVDGIGGFPAVRFVSASFQRLISEDDALASLLDGSQAYTTYWVASFASFGGTVWSCGSTTTAHRVESGASGAGLDRAGRRGATTVASDGTIASATNTPVLLTQAYTGSAYQSWKNGVVSLASGANTVVPTCDRFCLGVYMQTGVGGGFNAHLNGWIGDGLIYLGVHTAAERAGIEMFLRRRYLL